ncbi:alpha-amylase family protein [Mycetocola zhujimingii]|uniref:Trehalose synthase n=1 Tax=Mycetocola zhujimingii TaxID=2079792 RepID=A0A2U1TCD2_9MICO|nr:alpha-amylase family protein [Mycetocola zhujimingii]AWB88073.1 trehalose synthase [Mycetocola zhujimingii]PWC06541.1 trehalose synthase [Mycetocola zhujimingii]
MKKTDTADLWWKNAVVYCLDVETFLDWNNDGVGDFAGLAQRIDYLAELGVTCLWLMPFYPTPDRDDGYDITDFYGVDSRLGHHGDLVEVLRMAKDRGMRVIADLVVNHTSDQHPWFKASRSSVTSPYRDFYVWRKDLPTNQPETVFPGQESGVWELDEKTGEYYLHRFYRHQPDLNVENPAVREEIAKIMGFWLELGLSGFRVDAVPFFIEGDPGAVAGDEYGDPHDYLKSLRAFLGRRTGDGILLGEVNLPREEQLTYFGGEAFDELTMQFDFVAMQKFYLSLAREDAAPLAEALASRPRLGQPAQWANFLRNHDELTLDQLSDAERDEVFTAFAPDEDMRVFGRGIIRRLPTMLSGDPRRIRMAYSLLFSMPGTPVLFYGEEIGMGENRDISGREAVRSPMQWTPEPNGGFSNAKPRRLTAPVVDDGYAPRFVNVAEQRHEPGSLLSFIRTLIRTYRNSSEIGWGDFEVLDQPNRAVLAHVVSASEGRMVALHNFGPDPVSLELTIPDTAAGTRLVDLLTTGEVTLSDDGAGRFELGGYGYRWLRVIEPGSRRLY